MNTNTDEKQDANAIAHTDLKPGDRFRLTEAGEPDENGLTSATIWEGTVTRVDADKVFYGPDRFDYLAADYEHGTWERLAPAEPKNLGAVVEFTIENGLTVRAVRTLDVEEFPFYNGYSMETYTWENILEADANPRVLHEGWDGK